MWLRWRHAACQQAVGPGVDSATPLYKYGRLSGERRQLSPRGGGVAGGPSSPPVTDDTNTPNNTLISITHPASPPTRHRRWQQHQHLPSSFFKNFYYYYYYIYFLNMLATIKTDRQTYRRSVHPPSTSGSSGLSNRLASYVD